ETLRRGLYHFERVRSVTDENALTDAVRRTQARMPVDRLEATVEAHVLPAAHVRENLRIYGTTSRSAWLCPDKAAMKEAARGAGIACAASCRGSSADEIRAFAAKTGYPLILKPLDGAGAAGTRRVDNDDELAIGLRELGVDQGRAIAVEEFLDGHEGF